MTKTARMIALGAILSAPVTLPAMAAQKAPPRALSSISIASYDQEGSQGRGNF
jgi:hypothetical protein